MAGDAIRTERAERRQVAALPWRRGADGGVEILLVTSRETRRWVTPKGGRMPGKTDAEAAAQEALEEAGVEGRVADEPVGSFRYLKVLKRRAARCAWCRCMLWRWRSNIRTGASGTNACGPGSAETPRLARLTNRTCGV